MNFKRLRQAFTRSASQENDANDELCFHLEKEIEKNMAAGISPDEARRRALIAFGGIQQTRESLREVHRGRFFEALLQDLRYGSRMLRKSPAFTIIAVLTLALGIGANTAIFSLIDAVVFRSLPIPDPSGLLIFQWRASHGPETHGYMNFGECEDQSDQAHPFGCSLPLPFFREVEAQNDVFSHIAGFASWQDLDLSGNGPATMVRNLFVSGDYFPTLGIRAYTGRLFVASDDRPEAAPVVVLNYGYWQSAFGGSPSAIGKTIKLNGRPFTIIGVTEPKFDALTLANKYDVWTPLARRPDLIPHWRPRNDQIDSFWILIIARAKAGVPIEKAQAAVSLLFRNEMIKGINKPIFKAEYNPSIELKSAPRGMGGSQKAILQPLYVLMLCVGVVLLIACANVAGLLLARSTSRQKEIAVRLALGAKRGRIIAQLLTESVLLSGTGGLLGLVIAIWSAKALVTMWAARSYRPMTLEAHLDWRVLAFTSGVSLLTGLVFGLAPAFRGSDIGLTSSLKASGGDAAMGTQKRRGITSGGILVSVQMALAIVVLVTAGLLVRTLNNLKSLDPGFETRSLLLFGVDPRLAGYKGPQIDNLYRSLQEKFSALPGVKSTTYSWMPLLSGGLSTTSFHRPGTPIDSKDQVDADVLPVGPKFFATMHIPILVGQDFTEADFAAAALNGGDKPGSAPTPVIVNQLFVKKYLDGKEPVGQLFGDENPDEPGEPKYPGYRIVGVVGDAKYNQLRREIMPTFYQPNIGGDAFFELRTAGAPTAILPAVRHIVGQENPDLALFRISSASEAIDRQLVNDRMTAQLATFFGLLALLLACLGLYGLLSYEVTRRTREIGIRMAVGAQSYNVVRLVLGKALLLIAVGAMAGIAVALGVTRLLTSFLFGVNAGDPATLVGVAVLLAAVALAACYIPARRATKVDPLVALRHE
jgi:predicted permease